MDQYKISFIFSTRNRLEYLKITLGKLLTVLNDHEEIVVVDGNSTDGSTAYLQELLAEGKIHQLLSEPDKCQAHGWNKAMLLAKGTIIKKIIDDDVFDYQSIRKCANYMIDHPEIDVMISNDLTVALNNYKEIQKQSRLSHFEQWRKGLKPSFTFGDVHLLIRRTSLSYIGLYHTGYVMMDWEYALHISYLNANIAYYTGFNALSVYHDQSISALKNERHITDQGNRASVFYEYAGDRADISTWSKVKIAIGKTINKQKNSEVGLHAPTDMIEIAEIYQYLQSQIELINTGGDFKFIEKGE